MRKLLRPQLKSLETDGALSGYRRVWLHVAPDVIPGPIEALARRLTRAIPEIEVGISGLAVGSADSLTLLPVPGDKRREAQLFLSDTAPDVCIFVGGPVHQALLLEAEALGSPLYLIGASATQFESRRFKWTNMRLGSSLRRFDRILTEDAETADKLVSLGARPWRIEVSGRLEEGALALDHNEAERMDLAESLATRQVWCATDLPVEELSLILSAHREALSRAHRSLLVIIPSEAEDADAIRGAVKAAGMRCVTRRETDEIDADTQVVVVDLPYEHGLWYRISPLAYFGGTISGAGNRDPFEAAALGSAVLHGLKTKNFAARFATLHNAGASRAISQAGDLGPALLDLIAPDKSALLAHRAWDVSSRGAEATDRVISLVHDALPDAA